ncbi:MULTISPECIES: ABC-F family ATP-binding cassette domain-containing protein [unclassified Enterococcus]|uniref:ABC-F family ATP-binding cassette domain-containing protein n=1 Tax=unclassified Enterococcus TaxID=2608891 RepID=UPI001556E1F5|nr:MULTISPECIES: ABC-F family ATP-binding cassette domain-containing protein [unclassified Enterococcus]MBS7577321.1 ABC-F family ATP-binding cassette domain-containing protein [Enterococcus sp. MMGLQ5-2]MBS7584586.1 ABC-F family ATP-binding cassette domain-containing protein [Enterococcus sp. MMGLQ5-1]NPD12441.1 ABC-F family ATP-binding cassette domain-containing protein [Enterococcus sp. MMGLQ5-1]NPD37155.1 ABC-F family ATP-binding cassette domain-containing protein [Enterococcus sp. MMGLQ5-2
MKELKVEHLRKSVGDKVLFSDVSFLLKENDRIGLIGQNGTGKTSLLSIIADEYGFDGDINPIQKSNDFRITYLSQLPNFNEDATVLDAVLNSDAPKIKIIRDYEKALSSFAKDASENQQNLLTEAEERMHAAEAWTLEAELKSILTQLKITDFQQKISQLSGGQKRRVQLANVLITPTDLLLLDEPTNHLDIPAILWLQNYLAKFKGILLFVTHDRYFLDAVSNKIFELRNQNIYEYQGNYASYLAQRAEQELLDENQAHKAKQLYKQELAWMRAGAQARSTKQQARINRFKALESSVKQQTTTGALNLQFEQSRIGKKVLEISAGTFEYNNRPIFEDFSLLVQNTDRIGIIGPNGAGKTTLLKIFTGELALTSGTIELGETVNIGYFSQEITGLPADKRLLPFLQEFAQEYKGGNGIVSITNLLEQFLFPKDSHGKLIGKLSGGERKRLYLLTLLIKRPNFLIMDEPTNDLDIDTLVVLEHFIDQFNGPVVIVSHDRYFMDKVAEKLLIIENQHISEYFGIYSDYLQEQPQDKSKAEVLAKASEKPKPKVNRNRLTYFEKKEWLTIEDEIAELEARIEAINKEMNECGSDFAKLNALQKELDEKALRLEEKYERWDYLSDKTE